MKAVQIILCAFLSFSANWSNGESTTSAYHTITPKHHLKVSQNTTDPIAWKRKQDAIAIGIIAINNGDKPTTSTENPEDYDTPHWRSKQAIAIGGIEINLGSKFNTSTENPEDYDIPLRKSKQAIAIGGIAVNLGSKSNTSTETRGDYVTDTLLWRSRQGIQCLKPIAFEDCLPKLPSPIQVCVEIESSVLNNFEIVYSCVRVKLSNNLKLELPCIYIEKSTPSAISREEVLSTIEQNAGIKICNDKEQLTTTSPSE